MQNEIDKIELLLENCEVITIEGKYIGEFCIDNISYSIKRIACNSIQEMHTAKHFSISVHRDANTEGNTPISGREKVFDRLHNWHDITSIYIYLNQDWFKEPKVKRFYMNWYYDEDDYGTRWSNENQKTHINQFGDLFIVVDKDKGINNIFNLEQIENVEYMNFIWKMYSI